jgi:hypothetical protein
VVEGTTPTVYARLINLSRSYGIGKKEAAKKAIAIQPISILSNRFTPTAARRNNTIEIINKISFIYPLVSS